MPVHGVFVSVSNNSLTQEFLRTDPDCQMCMSVTCSSERKHSNSRNMSVFITFGRLSNMVIMVCTLVQWFRHAFEWPAVDSRSLYLHMVCIWNHR